MVVLHLLQSMYELSFGQCLILIQIVLFPDLTIDQVAMIGWIFGAILSLTIPFYLKVRAGTLSWSDFNFGYVINFIITLITGIGASLLIFAFWTIPDGSQIFVFLIALFTAAGFDQELVIRILGKGGLYEAVYNRMN